MTFKIGFSLLFDVRRLTPRSTRRAAVRWPGGRAAYNIASFTASRRLQIAPSDTSSVAAAAAPLRLRRVEAARG